MVGGNVNFDHLNDVRQNGPTDHKESMLTDQDIEIDYELERKIML
jgi:hypothetical protein